MSRLDGKLLRGAIDYALANQGLCIKNKKIEKKDFGCYEYDEIWQRWVLKIKKGFAYVCVSNKNISNFAFTINKVYFSPEDGMLTDDKNESFYFFNLNDTHYFRPWEIADAKHGDIIIFNKNKMLMYRALKSIDTDTAIIEPICYISISDNVARFEITEKGVGTLSYNKYSIKPATEEEKKTFFNIMAENGYVWDADKKDIVNVKKFPSFKSLIDTHNKSKRHDEIHRVTNQIRDLLFEHKCHLEIGTSKFGGDGIYVCACEEHPVDWDERLSNVNKEKKIENKINPE